MKRLLLIAKERKTQVLIALAALTIAILAAAGSGAWFTARNDIPGAAVVTGNMAISTDATSTFFMNAQNMAPGDTRQGSITITNTGTLPGKVSIASLAASETAGIGSTTGTGQGYLSETLQLSIVGPSGDLYSDGPISAFPTDLETASDDATLAVGASRTYTFTITMPENAEDGIELAADGDPLAGTDNAWQGASSEFPFTWEIHSVGGETANPIP